MARSSITPAKAARAVAAGLAALALARFARRRAQRIDLAGKVAIVTGGSRGLGLLIAEELGRRGARVAICGREERAVDEAQRRLTAQGIDVLAWHVDLGDREQATEFVERAAHAWERLDIVVNNAGVMHVEPLATVEHESIEEAMRSNFWGAANVTFAALPHLRAQGHGARIVNIASIGGRVAVPHMIGYSASKFALAGFSEGLAAELAREGICVTTVFPWLMRTGSYNNAEFAGDAASELAWFSLGGSVPVVSVGARRAARRIVRALQDGDRIVHLGLPAALLARAHALAPGLFIDAMALIDRLLPRPPAVRQGNRRGRDIATPLRRSVLAFGERAARENNEAPPEA